MKAFIFQSSTVSIFKKKSIEQIGLGIENQIEEMLFLLINQILKWHFVLLRAY
jgi:hypothetical protein